MKAAIPQVQRRLEAGLYTTRFERTSAGERIYLSAMANLVTSGTAHSSAVAKALGRSLTDLSPVRDRLIRKGVIYSPAPGEVAFSVPGFAEYVIARTSR